ncbi:MAG: hypothetical protein ACREEM_40630 [Blastocatellia bacterium]
MNQAELRRLLSHLRNRIADAATLARFEDELRDEYVEEFLRDPELLDWFPLLQEEMEISGRRWMLRVIPHAHLRIVQRGIRIETVLNLFQRFVEFCAANGEPIATRPYAVYSRVNSREATLTLRFDVDFVSDESGRAHVVTVFIGRGGLGIATEIELP